MNEPLENDEEISLDTSIEKAITKKEEIPLKLENTTKYDQLPKMRIRFLHSTPSFIWKDMKVYGPFERGNETDMFQDVAELLVRKGRAEKV